MAPAVRTVVTGGAGFIGSHAADRLLRLGHDVVVIDDLSRGLRANVAASATLVEHDITKPGTSRLVEDLQPEVLVHAAAQASVATSIRDPARDARVNVVGFLEVLAGAARSSCRQVIYLSTGGALYGQAAQLPTPESSDIRPLSPYGLSKWIAERYLEQGRPTSIRRVSLRLANVYGPRQRADGEGGVVGIFMERIVRGEPVDVFGDGEQTRDFVFVDDVVDALILALDARESVTLNIGTGVQTSVNALLATLSDVMGASTSVRHGPERAGEVRDSCLDPSRAADAFGWRPKTDLVSGLRATAVAEGLLRP